MREITVGVAPDMKNFVPWRYGLDVASGWKARLCALMVNDSFVRGAHVFAPGDVLAESMARVREVWEGAAEEAELRLRDQARKRQVRFEVVRKEGRMVDALLAAEKTSELLVVGRGRNSGSHPGSFGSRVEPLVRHCTGALLLTPYEYREPRRVVAAYAAKSLGDQVLDLGSDLAQAFGGGLIVLTVGDDRERIRVIQQRARERLSGKNDEVDYVSLSGKPEVAILSKVEPDDVLVLGSHGRSAIYRMLLGRVTDRVIRAARGPIALAARAG